MKRDESVRTMTESLSDPKYTDFAESIRFLEENQDKILYQSKYLAAQKDFISEKVQNLKRTRAALPLKDVVSLLLKGMPENISSDMLLDITRHIIAEWERASEPVKAAV